MSRRRRSKLVARNRKLQERVRELEEELESFAPTDFDRRSCPLAGRCVVANCERLDVRCRCGEERDCIKCVYLTDDEGCDNWGWRNCVIAREAWRLGYARWAERYGERQKYDLVAMRDMIRSGVED